jgi:hypothetical protein
VKSRRANSRRPFRREPRQAGALRELIGLLRGRIDAAEDELADARHFLDEIETAVGASGPEAGTEMKE